MTSHTHNHADHALYQKPPAIDADPILLACWKLAQASHREWLPSPASRTGEKRAPKFTTSFREKADDVELPYLTHPELTLRILLAAGKTDRLLLTTALLHDVVENHYIPEARRLSVARGEKIDETACRTAGFAMFETDLAETLIPYYHRLHPRNERLLNQDVKNIVSAISQLMGEVTNDTSMPEGKLLWQVTRAESLTKRAKLLKMADHAASMVCDLLIEPKKKEKMWPFAEKALAVADACRDSSPPLFHLIENLRDEIYAVSKDTTGTRRKAFREGFDLQRAMQASEVSAKLSELHPKAAPAMQWQKHPCADALAGGLIGVAFDKEGKVSGYRMLSNLTEDDKDPANAAVNALLSAVQSDGNYAQFGHPGLTDEGRLARRFTLMRHSLPLETFLDMARKAKAIDDMFDQQLSALTVPGRVVDEPFPPDRLTRRPPEKAGRLPA